MMTSPLPPLNIHLLMKKYDLQAHKSLGQNFLHDDGALRKVIQSAEVTSDMQVLEIGAGLGSLTRYLGSACRSVVAVEIDDRLIPALHEVLDPFSNIEIVQGDILKLNPADLMSASGYAVVANIPYYITSAIIRHLLESEKKPGRIVLTVQKEVADRICAQPDDMNLLALSVQLYGDPRIVATIPAGAFYPPPKVDSAVVRVDLFEHPILEPQEIDLFFKLAHAGFGQKRKTLRNSLSSGLAKSAVKMETYLTSVGIDPRRRAETLYLEEWFDLVRNYPADL
jgi:16S rRNA (adenine1518-N6/adenine1519-N6)-dimethyltransferase